MKNPALILLKQNKTYFYLFIFNSCFPRWVPRRTPCPLVFKLCFRGTLVIFMGRSGQGSGWRKCRSRRHTYFHANKYHSEGAGVLKCVVGSSSFLSGVSKNCHGAIALDGPWIVFQKCSWKRNCQETPAHLHCLEIQAAVPNHP